MSTALLLLLATSCVLGFRHGIDWDHMAAVADIVSGQPRPGLAIRYGSLYALGHSLIIFGVGLLAILLSLNLPRWMDGFMEQVVGSDLASAWSMGPGDGHGGKGRPFVSAVVGCS